MSKFVKSWAARGSLAAIAGIVVILIATTSPNTAADNERPGLSIHEEESNIPIVATVAVQPAPAAQDRAFPGVVEAADGGSVAFVAPGRVVEIIPDVGDQIEAGTVVAVQDRSGPSHAVREARAALSAISEQLAQARRELDRVEQLGEAATTQERDQRQSAVLQLAAEQDRAAAGYEEAQRRLAETEIIAPYRAVVTAIPIREGEVVGAGTPVAILSSLGDGREIEIDVPADIAALLTAGSAARVDPTVTASDEIPARVRTVSRHAARPTMLFPVVLDIDGEIPVGTPASVIVSIPLPQDLVSVPAAAVVGGPDQRPRLYAVRNDQIDVIAVDEPRRSGSELLLPPVVSTGERVVISGHVNLSDGLVVEQIDNEAIQ